MRDIGQGCGVSQGSGTHGIWMTSWRSERKRLKSRESAGKTDALQVNSAEQVSRASWWYRDAGCMHFPFPESSRKYCTVCSLDLHLASVH